MSIKIEYIFGQLSRELNRMGNGSEVEDALQCYLRKEHPTLQQNFFKHVVIPAIKIYAEKHDKGFFDARNEASCKIAKDLEPLVKDQYLPFI